MTACYLLDPAMQRRVPSAAARHAGAIAAPPATPGPGITPPPEPHWPPMPDVLPPDIEDPEPPEPTEPIKEPPRVQYMLPVIERWFWYAGH